MDVRACGLLFRMFMVLMVLGWTKHLHTQAVALFDGFPLLRVHLLLRLRHRPVRRLPVVPPRILAQLRQVSCSHRIDKERRLETHTAQRRTSPFGTSTRPLLCTSVPSPWQD